MAKKIKVKLNVDIAGTADAAHEQPEFGYSAGQVVAVHHELAEAWIASGTAQRAEKDESITEAAALQTDFMAMHPAVVRRMRGYAA